ncbi:hypothetical protein C1J02_07410 [Sulfitobacter sp. SK011]|nr:hypothetical protein C1J02_07410 [Sulfitobacter sp. SK011]
MFNVCIGDMNSITATGVLQAHSDAASAKCEKRSAALSTLCDFMIGSANGWFHSSQPLASVHPDDRVADFPALRSHQFNCRFRLILLKNSRLIEA